MDERAAASLDETGKTMLAELTPQLQNDRWSRESLEGIFDAFITGRGVKFGTLATPLRAALAGRANSPSVYDMMLLLGREETIARLRDTVGN